MEEGRKRHCWECLRRCLVCDFTRPACKRCCASGTACPGYSDTKPPRLKWLPPGRETSRKRKRRGTHSNDVENSKPEASITWAAAEPLSGSSDYVVEIARFEMWTDTCVLAQAAEYYNACIYQDLTPIHELGQNPHVYRISAAHIRTAATHPDFIRFGMVCMTMSHHMNRTSFRPRRGDLTESFYRYRGSAIRSLNETIGAEHKRTADVVIAGMLTVLLMDAQQGVSSDWRCHVKAIQKVVSLRGGIRAVAESRVLEPQLLFFVFIRAIGNTTCPASDLTMTGLQVGDLDFILERFGSAISPFHMCPPTLFIEVIKINHLRMLAASHDRSMAGNLAQEACSIAGRIGAFSPEQWAQSKPSSMEDWMCLGNIYQSAVGLYCILSLQSLSVLPPSSTLRTQCATHAQILLALVKQALSSPKTKRFMIWPLVVLGVEAVHGDLAMRTFVGRQLAELSRYAGTYVPFVAKGVLERFWASGETTWDACFDRPYAFTTQIAVDMSGILG